MLFDQRRFSTHKNITQLYHYFSLHLIYNIWFHWHASISWFQFQITTITIPIILVLLFSLFPDVIIWVSRARKRIIARHIRSKVGLKHLAVISWLHRKQHQLQQQNLSPRALSIVSKSFKSFATKPTIKTNHHRQANIKVPLDSHLHRSHRQKSIPEPAFIIHWTFSTRSTQRHTSARRLF